MATGDKPVDVTGMSVTKQDEEPNSVTIGLRVAYQTSPSYKYLNVTVQKDVSGVVEGPFDDSKTYSVVITEE